MVYKTYSSEYHGTEPTGDKVESLTIRIRSFSHGFTDKVEKTGRGGTIEQVIF